MEATSSSRKYSSPLKLKHVSLAIYQLWSALAKTVAEKAAWSLARDRGLDLVVMNPAIVTGPNPKISGISPYFQPWSIHCSAAYSQRFKCLDL